VVPFGGNEEGPVKRFQFSLERVLTVRKIREKQRQRETAQAANALEKENQLLHAMQSAEEKSLRDLESLQSKGSNSALVAMVHNSLEGQRQRRQRQQTKARSAGQRVEVCRTALVKAMRSKRIMEKLREYRLEEYWQEAERNEQKALDEVASLKAEANKRDQVNG